MVKINYQQLKKILPGLRRNILLKNYTTFRIGGPARYFFKAETKKDLIQAVKIAKRYNLPFFILGGGSNLLVSDKGFKGIVIKIQLSDYRIKGSEILTEAGTPLSLLVSKSIEKNLTGFEWAAGIPGTIGGAVRGNAGAFGGETKDVVKEVEVFNLKNLKTENIKNSDCQFGYRESVFKKKRNFIIFSVVLKLEKNSKKKIKETTKKYLIYRKERHPQEPSAGSVFKNIGIDKLKRDFLKKFPKAKKVIKGKTLPVAFLINQCQLAGKKIGKAQISKDHPNFIINIGDARAEDVKKLINLTKKKVKSKFGIILKEEVYFLGF